MIKEALQYIVGLNEPEIVEIDGNTYSDKDLKRLEPVIIRSSESVHLDTLTSLVDYVKAQVDRDGIYNYKDLYIKVDSPNKVTVFERDCPLDGRKTYICTASATLPRVDYERYYDSESFNILLQSRFCQDETTAKLLSIVGNIKTSDVQTTSDNGITQTVQTNKGIVLKENTELPNPVVLAPFRTFVEIPQVSSPFIFRARSEGREEAKEIYFALFEADGVAWAIEATQRIKTYLEKAFDGTDVIVLA